MALDIDQLVKDILSKLQVATVEKEEEVKRDLNTRASYILNNWEWKFLEVTKKIAVQAGKKTYGTADGFPNDLLYPISLSTDYGPVEKITEEKLRFQHPDLTLLSGYPAYAVFETLRQVSFYPYNLAANVYLTYKKPGTINDLLFDDGFYDILKDIVIADNTPLNATDPAKASLIIFKDHRLRDFKEMVRDKALTLANALGAGQTYVIPEKRDRDIMNEMRNEIWSED